MPYFPEMYITETNRTENNRLRVQSVHLLYAEYSFGH